MDENQTPIAETPVVETPVVETPVVETVENQTTQPVEQKEDSFAQNFDPNSLPPELQTGYKQMQSDYTKKMQELSKQRADVEKLAPYKDILAEMLNEKGQSDKTPSVGQAVVAQLKEAGYDQNAIDFAQKIVNAMEAHNQAQKQQETQVQETTRLTSEIQQAAQIDPRLNDPNLVYKTASGQTKTFGQIVEGLVASSDNWRGNVVAATKEAIETVDAMIGTAKQQGKVELSNSAKQKSEKFAPVNSSPQETIQSDGNLSVREAFELAQKQAGM